ncbi:MAG TPA: hypothetical protein PLO36_07120 [Methanofastidiosum sp.]|jgi:hypothetical protein|nr:hypothetical protein [Methanofastidiosum sp.]
MEKRGKKEGKKRGKRGKLFLTGNPRKICTGSITEIWITMGCCILLQGLILLIFNKRYYI